MLAAFAAPSSLAELYSSAFGIPDDVLEVCVDLLWTLRFLRRVDVAGAARGGLDEAVDAGNSTTCCFTAAAVAGGIAVCTAPPTGFEAGPIRCRAIKPLMSAAVIPLFRPDSPNSFESPINPSRPCSKTGVRAGITTLSRSRTVSSASSCIERAESVE